MGASRGTRWHVLPQDPAAAAAIQRELGVTPLVARCLVAQGVTDAAAARAFLSPSLERDWADQIGRAHV